MTPSTLVAGAVVLLALAVGNAGIACFSSRVAHNPKLRFKFAAISVLLLVIGGLLLFVRVQLVRSAQDSARESAYLCNILKTDKDARLNRMSGVQRGPKDAEPKWGERERGEELTPQQVADACRIIDAFTQADLKSLHAVLVQYEGRPYARAQIAASLSYVFYVAGLDLYWMTHEKWFYIEDQQLGEGRLAITVTPLDEAPEVQLSAEHAGNPGQYDGRMTTLIDAQTALSIMQRESLRKFLLTEQAKSVPTRD